MAYVENIHTSELFEWCALNDNGVQAFRKAGAEHGTLFTAHDVLLTHADDAVMNQVLELFDKAHTIELDTNRQFPSTLISRPDRLVAESAIVVTGSKVILGTDEPIETTIMVLGSPDTVQQHHLYTRARGLLIRRVNTMLEQNDSNVRVPAIPPLRHVLQVG